MYREHNSYFSTHEKKIYFKSKIDEIFPYCPDNSKAPKIEIHVGNLT